MTNFLQGYVDNELNLNTEDSCTQNCADYTKTKNYLCSPDTVCGETDTRHRHLSVCKGNVHDCVDIGDIDTKLCHAADPLRRYNYMLFSNNELIGLPDRPCELISKVSETQPVIAVIAPKKIHVFCSISTGENMAPMVCQVQQLLLFVRRFKSLGATFQFACSGCGHPTE